MNSYYNHMIEQNERNDSRWQEAAQRKIDRLSKKLSGHDFDENNCLSVPEQIDALIEEAIDPENLASLFTGWCPFW